MSETPDETPDLQPPDTVEDFDAFWQRDPERVQVKIMGDVVALPSSLPLAFEMEARRLARVKGTEGAVVRRLLTLLGFPEGTLQASVSSCGCCRGCPWTPDSCGHGRRPRSTSTDPRT